MDSKTDLASGWGGSSLADNRRIEGEVVLEPMGSGLRVTARDKDHRVLWGYVGSNENVGQIHCLVATYDTLQKLIREELAKRKPCTAEDEDPIAEANRALDQIEATAKHMRASINVKKVSEATKKRARTLCRIVSDADRQMTLEASALAGISSKTE